jgi:hypothetical protein
MELNIPEYGDEPPDDAIAEIAKVAPGLTSQERLYVYWRSIALPPGAAFQKAGYAGTGWRAVETRPKIRAALQDLNELLEPDYRITQKRVVGILMEAVDIARRRDQAKNLIEAAVALANVAGVMSATKLQVNGTHNHLLSVRPELAALQLLPRVGLEELVGIRRTLPALMPPVEEGVFEEVAAAPA